jgi:hypothetical protein
MMAYMTDREIAEAEERMLRSLRGDHSRAVDELCRLLVRTLAELKLRRRGDSPFLLAAPARTAQPV